MLVYISEEGTDMTSDLDPGVTPFAPGTEVFITADASVTQELEPAEVLEHLYTDPINGTDFYLVKGQDGNEHELADWMITE